MISDQALYNLSTKKWLKIGFFWNIRRQSNFTFLISNRTFTYDSDNVGGTLDSCEVFFIYLVNFFFFDFNFA